MTLDDNVTYISHKHHTHQILHFKPPNTYIHNHQSEGQTIYKGTNYIHTQKLMALLRQSEYNQQLIIKPPWNSTHEDTHSIMGFSVSTHWYHTFRSLTCCEPWYSSAAFITSAFRFTLLSRRFDRRYCFFNSDNFIWVEPIGMAFHRKKERRAHMSAEDDN